uniref:Translationally-controlled tumor protein homolog n=1 Tax=Pectinaria gouldii TaxID=260746 RepID=A0A0K1R049_PECGU|nr:putative translationally controlled tumor protein [Pectinaria gouldii]
MKIYKDIITGDELFSDTYTLEETPCLFKVKCKLIKETSGFDDKLLGGANPSGEEPQEESYDENTVTGLNVVLQNRLVEMPIDKKGWTKYIKDYMKSIKSKLEEDSPDKVKEFTSSAQAAVKEILGEFKEYQFFCGESMNPDGMLAFLKWEDDGANPVMSFFKHGLIEEKV